MAFQPRVLFRGSFLKENPGFWGSGTPDPKIPSIERGYRRIERGYRRIERGYRRIERPDPQDPQIWGSWGLARPQNVTV
jgi:hypothetical protein